MPEGGTGGDPLLAEVIQRQLSGLGHKFPGEKVQFVRAEPPFSHYLVQHGAKGYRSTVLVVYNYKTGLVEAVMPAPNN